MNVAWESLRDGSGCPFCMRENGPGRIHLVEKLSVSSLCLNKDQRYRGACLLIYDPRHVVRPDQLSEDEWLAFAADARVAETAIFRTFHPDHINVELLGNGVPHLHWHIIPRYKNDGRWGLPIWMSRREDMRVQLLEEGEYRTLAAQLKAAIPEARSGYEPGEGYF